MRSSGEGNSLSTYSRENEINNLDYSLMIWANGETSDCYSW